MEYFKDHILGFMSFVVYICGWLTIEELDLNVLEYRDTKIHKIKNLTLKLYSTDCAVQNVIDRFRVLTK